MGGFSSEGVTAGESGDARLLLPLPCTTVVLVVAVVVVVALLAALPAVGVPLPVLLQPPLAALVVGVGVCA